MQLLAAGEAPQRAVDAALQQVARTQRASNGCGCPSGLFSAGSGVSVRGTPGAVTSRDGVPHGRPILRRLGRRHPAGQAKSPGSSRARRGRRSRNASVGQGALEPRRLRSCRSQVRRRHDGNAGSPRPRVVAAAWRGALHRRPQNAGHRWIGDPEPAPRRKMGHAGTADDGFSRWRGPSARQRAGNSRAGQAVLARGSEPARLPTC